MLSFIQVRFLKGPKTENSLVKSSGVLARVAVRETRQFVSSANISKYFVKINVLIEFGENKYPRSKCIVS